MQSDRITAMKKTVLDSRALLLIVLAALLFSALVVSGCAEDTQSTSEGAQGSAQEQTEGSSEQDASFTAHGSAYEKSETVAVNTDFAGRPSAISVSEWIKNPEELESIVDVSTLQAIAAQKDENDAVASFTQEGEEVVWQANGADINYTGTTDKELPFKISYSFKLDGEELDPNALEGLEGELEVQIHYENLSHGNVNVNGTTHEIQQPYVMASMISFDSEHARGVSVDGGTVMDQNGSFMVVGIAAPGLARTLELEDMLDLPDTVTITAEVSGFDMPDIRTIVTDQALAMVDDSTLDDANSQINDAFGQLDNIKTALGALEQGTSGMSQAMTQINGGLTKLNEAFPQAASGLDGLKQGADGTTALLASSNASLADARADQATSLEALSTIDTSTLSAEQKEAIDRAVLQLKESQGKIDAAAHGTQQAQASTTQLGSGLEKIQEGLGQIQAGYEGLGAASGKVSEVAEKLNTAVSTMSEGVNAAFSQMQGSLEEKFDLIRAIRTYTEEQGAFGGNHDSMAAATMFIVTASAA